MTPTAPADPTQRATALGAAVPSGSRTSGLTAVEAAARLALDGPNAIGGGGRRTLAAILVSQVASPLVLILVAAALVSLVVGDAVTTAIILSIVAMSAALGFVQEARSESAVAALQARLTLLATVVRDGAPVDVPIHDVVRDDPRDRCALRRLAEPSRVVHLQGLGPRERELHAIRDRLREGAAAEREHPRPLDPAGAHERHVGRPAAHVDEERARGLGLVGSQDPCHRVRLGHDLEELEVERGRDALECAEVDERGERVRPSPQPSSHALALCVSQSDSLP